MYIVITEHTKQIPAGKVFLATFDKNLPLIGFVFGCNAKKKDGKPITKVSSKINWIGENG